MRTSALCCFVGLLAMASAPSFIGCSGRDASSPVSPRSDEWTSPRFPDPSFEESEVVLRAAHGTGIDEINARYGTTTLEVLGASRFYRLGLPEGTTVEQMVDATVDDPGVASCQPNFNIEGPEARQSSMSFDDGVDDVNLLEDQRALSQVRAWIGHRAGAGAGVLVAVLDTGIDPDHPYLVGRIEPGGSDFIDLDSEPWDEANGFDDDFDGFVDEALGHGTHISGLVAAVAPQCRILPLRVLDSDGVGTAFTVASGIRYAVDHGATVVNLSLGMFDEPDVIEEAVEYAQAGGAVCVAAVGNDASQTIIHFPAIMPSVISVLAVDAFDVLAPFTNFDRCVTVAAPGVGVYSTFWDGGFATWSGTSMATGIMSGAVAVLRGLRPDLGVDAVRDRIRSTGLDISESNPQLGADVGGGRLDLGLLLGIETRDGKPVPIDWR